MKVKNFEDFTEHQQKNISEIIDWYNRKENTYQCDLSHIPVDKEHKATLEYCGKTYTMQGNSIEYKGQSYWDLDNL